MNQIETKVYTGTPNDIIEKLSEEIAKALANAGLAPHALNIMAMFHVAVGCLLNLRDGHDPKLGKAPSNTLIMRAISHALVGHDWSEEEKEEFTEEFLEILRSMGGQQVSEEEMNKLQNSTMFMAPPSKELH